MLTCPAQDLRVTAWIIAHHASIFSRQQGHREYQPAPRPAEHSSLHSIVASHLSTHDFAAQVGPLWNKRPYFQMDIIFFDWS